MSSRKLTKGDRARSGRVNAGVKIYNSDDDRPKAHIMSPDSHWKELPTRPKAHIMSPDSHWKELPTRPKAHIMSPDSHWKELQYQKYLRVRMRQGLRDKEALLVDGKGRLITLAERILRFRLHQQNGAQGEAESGMSRAPPEAKREKANLRTLLNQYVQQREKERALSAEIIGEINAAKLSFKEDESLQGLSPTKSYACGSSSSTDGARDSSSDEKLLDDEEKVEARGKTAMSGEQRTGHSPRTSSRASRTAEFWGGRKTIIVDEDGSVLERVQVSAEPRHCLEGTKETEKDNGIPKEDKGMEKDGVFGRDTLGAGEKVDYLMKTEDAEENGRVLQRTENMAQNVGHSKRPEDSEGNRRIVKSNVNEENTRDILETTEDTEDNANILKRLEDTEENANILERTENMEDNGNIQNKNEDAKDNEIILKRNEVEKDNDSVRKNTNVTEENRNILKSTEGAEYDGGDRIKTESKGDMGEQSNGICTVHNNRSQIEDKPKVGIKIGVLSSVLLEQNGKSYSSMDVTNAVTCYDSMNTDKCSQLETGECDVFENNGTYGEVTVTEPTETGTENDASSDNAAFSFVVEEQTKEINSIVSEHAVSERTGLLTNELEKDLNGESYRNQSDKTGADTEERISVSSNGLKVESMSSPKQSRNVMMQTEEPANKRHHVCDSAKPKHAPRRLLTEKLYGIRHATVLEKIRSKSFMPSPLPNVSNETHGRRTPKDVLAYLSRGNTEDSEESFEFSGFTARDNKIYEFIDYLNERSYTLPEIVLQCNEKQHSNTRNAQKTMQRADGIKSHLKPTNNPHAVTSNEKKSAQTLLPRLFNERTNSTLSTRGRELGERPKTILPSLKGSSFPHVAQHSVGGSQRGISRNNRRVHKVKSSILREPTRASDASFPEKTGSNLEDLDDREKRIIALYNDLSSYCAFHSSPSDVSISMHRKQSRLNMRIEWGIIPKEDTSYFSKVKAQKHRKSAKKKSFASSNSVNTEKEGSEDSFKVNCDGQKKQLSDHFIYLREISFSRFIQQSEKDNRVKKYLEPVSELVEPVPSTRKKAGSSGIQEHARKNKARAQNLSLTYSRHANCFDFDTKRRLK